jgi:hypothetical protein
VPNACGDCTSKEAAAGSLPFITSACPAPLASAVKSAGATALIITVPRET